MQDASSTIQSSSFTIFYDSNNRQSPLVDHEMALSDLSIALQGLKEIFETSNEILNGKDAELDVRVKAGFEEGSFGILLELLTAPGALDILTFIGISSVSGFFAKGMALATIEKLRGRSIEEIAVADDGSFNLSIDGETINCHGQAKRLIVNKRFRNAVSKVFVSAGQRSRVSEIGLKFEGGERKTLGANQAAHMKASEDIYKNFVEVEEVEDAKIRFLTAHADKAGQWRIEYLGNHIIVEILDEPFLEKIKSQDNSFSFGKAFNARLKITKRRSAGSKRVSKSYAIDKIHTELK